MSRFSRRKKYFSQILRLKETRGCPSLALAIIPYPHTSNMNSCECLLCQTRCCLILSCFFQISAGRTHSAAWTTPCPPQRIPGVPVPLQLGTPDKIPASCSTLRECPIEDIQGRLKLLHHFSDLIYSSWRLLPLTTIAQVYRGCIKYRRE